MRELGSSSQPVADGAEAEWRPKCGDRSPADAPDGDRARPERGHRTHGLVHDAGSGPDRCGTPSPATGVRVRQRRAGRAGPGTTARRVAPRGDPDARRRGDDADRCAGADRRHGRRPPHRTAATPSAQRAPSWSRSSSSRAASTSSRSRPATRTSSRSAMRTPRAASGPRPTPISAIIVKGGPGSKTTTLVAAADHRHVLQQGPADRSVAARTPRHLQHPVLRTDSGRPPRPRRRPPPAPRRPTTTTTSTTTTEAPTTTTTTTVAADRGTPPPPRRRPPDVHDDDLDHLDRPDPTTTTTTLAPTTTERPTTTVTPTTTEVPPRPARADRRPPCRRPRRPSTTTRPRSRATWSSRPRSPPTTRRSPDNGVAKALAFTGGSSTPLVVVGIVLLLSGATLALVHGTASVRHRPDRVTTTELLDAAPRPPGRGARRVVRRWSLAVIAVRAAVDPGHRLGAVADRRRAGLELCADRCRPHRSSCGPARHGPPSCEDGSIVGRRRSARPSPPSSGSVMNPSRSRDSTLALARRWDPR